MTTIPERNDPNLPGWDPSMAFAPADQVQMPPKPQPATAYTLSGADFFRVVNNSNAAATTVTVPSDATAPELPLGALIGVGQYGAGTVTIVPAAGVTLKRVATAIPSARINGLSGVLYLQKQAANVWLVVGSSLA